MVGTTRSAVTAKGGCFDPSYAGPLTGSTLSVNGQCDDYRI